MIEKYNTSDCKTPEIIQDHANALTEFILLELAVISAKQIIKLSKICIPDVIIKRLFAFNIPIKIKFNITKIVYGNIILAISITYKLNSVFLNHGDKKYITSCI